MNTLFSVAQIREIERAAYAQLPPGTLMQRAGAASARLALELMPSPHGLCKVLVLAGPGDNGGDALDCAARLAQAGMQVSALLFAQDKNPSNDAKMALLRAQGSAVNFIDPASMGEATSAITSTRWNLVVDGLFGIGLTRPIVGALHSLIESINHFHCTVLSLDVPSGLDADSGNVVGPHGLAVRASHTITFIGDKPGLHTGQGRDHAGVVHVARLEIDGKLYKPSHVDIGQVSLFARYLHARPHHCHKGNFGNVVVVGGASGMAGAALLAAHTALKTGAGRTFIAFAADVGHYPNVDLVQPEIMCRHAPDMDFHQSVLVIGPGLGTSRLACELVERALGSASPIVIDADALNLIALEESLQQQLQARRAITLLTPHPLEAARLLGHLAGNAELVQKDRLGAARELARRFNASVILKGSGSVIANAHGHVVINPTGNPALATGGTGDVLAGLCGALLAQHWPEWEAALAGCWIHGAAADA
ncbi:MAG: NAD(P)H-hydrate dehydratase, partial [Burkholderiales bacterium]|nr:NAD(P)H-hydrate dehydratase [Burkholderiales bacterium]